jgi:predicted small integral membrane protein
MGIRHLKVILVLIISLLCLAYATQNMVNLDPAYQSFVYVMSNADHSVYGLSFMPSISHPVLLWIALFLVVGLELIAGLVTLQGFFRMWASRNASALEFNESKKYALLGCGLGIIVWLGIFGVFGGAFFQMWQTDIGKSSMDGAYQFFMSCAMVFIIVSMKDE